MLEMQNISILMENCLQPFAAWRPGGKTLVFNRAFCNLVGFTRDELMNMSWPRDITPIREQQYQVKMYEKQLAIGKPVCFKSEYIHNSGCQIPVEVLVHSLVTSDGKPFYQYIFVADLAERKQSETDPRQIEERLRKAFYANPYAMAILAWPEVRYVEINDEWMRTTGFHSKDQVIGFTPSELRIWADEEQKIKFRESLLENGNVRSMEARLVTTNGEIITTLVCADFIDVFGKKLIMTSLKDINEQKLMEKADKEQMNLLEDFSCTITDAAAILDEDGNIIRIFGDADIISEHHLNKDAGQVLPDLLTAKLLSMIPLVVQKNKPVTTECEFSVGGRVTYKKVTAAPMQHYFQNKRTVALYVQDITVIKAAEARLNSQIYQRSMFLNDLLSKDYSQEYINTQLGNYGIDTRADYCCYVILINGDGQMKKKGLIGDGLHTGAVIKESVIVWLVARVVGWVWKRNEHIIILMPIHKDNGSKEQQVEFANRLIQDLEKRFAFTNAKVGISATYESSDLGWDFMDLYQRAKRALDICIHLSTQTIVHHADLGLNEIACKIRNDSNTLTLVQQTVGRLFDYDKAHASNLMITLERIIEDGNLRTVARKLYVHPNTVNWRKKRIEEMLGLSLDVFETKALLSIYLKIWKLQFLDNSM